jgi:hypothetical protein
VTNVVEGQERSPVEERLRNYYRQEASVTSPDLWSRLAPRLAAEGVTQLFAHQRRLLTRALVAAVAAAVVGVALVLWSVGGGGVDTVSADEVVENMRDIYGVPAQDGSLEGDVILDLGNIQVSQTTDPQTGRTIMGVRQAAGDGTLSADSIAALVAQVGDGFEANLAESEELDGVEHYVLVLTPSETSPLWPDTEIKLWVNADTYLVSQMSMSSVSGGFNSSGGSIEDEDLPEPQDGSGTRYQPSTNQVTP